MNKTIRSNNFEEIEQLEAEGYEGKINIEADTFRSLESRTGFTSVFLNLGEYSDEQAEQLRLEAIEACDSLLKGEAEEEQLQEKLHALTARLKQLEEERNKTVTTLTKPLEKMPINYSFDMKVLEGFEHIAYGEGGGVFTLQAKSRTDQKTVLSAPPKLCRDFIANDGANWEYAARIAAVVYELIRKPEAAAMKTDGRVWVSTSTIAKELTRTAEGANTYAAHNEAFRKLVMDGLRALSSAQISSHDASGNLQFMGYLLQAEYLAEAKDAAGNTIKDIWGFSVDKEALAFAVFTEKSTVNAPLLNMKPLNKKNAWIVQALRGDVLSEIRAKLYPKRGTGLKEYTARRSWSDIFDSAKVTADGNLSYRVKRRIVIDFEEQLKAFAEIECKAEKPIYIEAKSTRDPQRGTGGGAWISLEVTGHKTFKGSYQIGLL